MANNTREDALAAKVRDLEARVEALTAICVAIA